MATILFKRVSKERASFFAISKDWYTLTPWKHKGKIVSYISTHSHISESGNVYFTYRYIGPFAILTGKWIG